MKAKFLQLSLVLSVLGLVSVQAQLNWADTLDRADWKIVSVTNQQAGNPAEQAFDGDPMSGWQTEWKEGLTTPLPHYITIDLGGDYEISELIYVPRQDQWGPNGTIRDYTIKAGFVVGDMDQAAGWFKPKYDEQNTVSGVLSWPEPISDPNNRDDFKDTVAMTMSRPLMGRYLRVQCDSGVSNVPEAIINEIYAVGRPIVPTENMISREYWKVVEADTALNAEWKAIDGNLASGWSTPWKPDGNPPAHPHHITIDMSEEVDIDSLLYICRQDVWGNNGMITKFELYVSNDMENWGDVEHADTIQWYDEWELPTAVDSLIVHKRPMMIQLDSVATGRYLKLVALAGSGNSVDGYDGPNRETHVNELYAYGAATGAQYEDVTSLIVNPGFEDGADAAGWEFGSWGNGTYIDTTEAAEGVLAGCIKNGSGGVGQPINIEGNTRYLIMAKGKTTGKMGLGAHGLPGKDGYDMGTEVAADDWTDVSVEIATSIGHTQSQLFFWTGNSDGAALADDYQLHKIGPANFEAPVAMAGDDQEIKATDTTYVDASKSYDMDGGTLTYAWSADDILTFDDASAAKPMVIAGSPAEDMAVEVTLTVTDGRHPVTDVVVITVKAGEVENQAPVADAGADQTVDDMAEVTLDGSSSSDPESADLTYAWTAPAGITLDDATAVGPKFTAPDLTEPTDYTFSLVVNDGELDSEADEVVVTVNGVNALNVNEAISFQVYPNPSQGVFTFVTETNVEIAVLDITGRSIVSETFEAGVNTLDLTQFGKGIFLVKLHAGDDVSTAKLIVE